MTGTSTEKARWARYHDLVAPELPRRWREVFLPDESELHEHGDEARFPCILHQGGRDSLCLNTRLLAWECKSCGAKGDAIGFLQQRDDISKEEARDRLAAICGVDLDGGAADPEQAFLEWCVRRRLDATQLRQVHGCVPGSFWWGKELRPGFEFATTLGVPRLRFTDGGKDKTGWLSKKERAKRGLDPSAKGAAHWYNLAHAAELLAQGGVLYLVNGEPSVWACSQSRVPAVCTCGGETSSLPKGVGPLAELLRAKAARLEVIYDLDEAGQKGARKVVAALRKAGLETRALRLPPELGAKGDVDDLHRRDEVGDAGLAAALAQLPPLEGDGGSAAVRPQVVLEPGRLDQTVTEVVAALAALAPPLVYQRSMALVRVVRELGDQEAGVKLANEQPTIRAVSSGIAPALIDRACELVKLDARSDSLRPISAPQQLCSAVLEVGEYPGVKRLRGVVPVPVLRPDGTLLSEPGYDARTGLLYQPTGSVAPVPERPSQDEARAAAEALLEIWADFPFRGPADRAGALSGLLTPFALPAIAGPVPAHYWDAPVAGSGKTLGARSGAWIFLGHEPPIYPWPSGERSSINEELRKALLGMALVGARAMILDNIDGPFGKMPALEGVLTSRRIQSRKLGTNEMPDLPWDCCIFATGNQAQIIGDMGRRIIHVRLVPAEERPEERQGFRHPRLMEWVAAERPRLAAAALTVLRAYCAAGQPRAQLPAMDYPAWSDLVRQVVVWVGFEDPAGTRAQLQEADQERTSEGALLEAWLAASRGEPISVADALADAQDGKAPELAEVLLEMWGKDGLPTSRWVGDRLRRLRDRTISGMRLVSGAPTRTKVARWGVEVVDPARGVAGSCRVSPPLNVGSCQDTRHDTRMTSIGERGSAVPAGPRDPAPTPLPQLHLVSGEW